MNQRLRDLESAREEAGQTQGDIAMTETTATFADATATIIKSTASPATSVVASGAKKLNDLTKARLAFNQELNASVEAYAQKLADATARKAVVFTKAHAAVDDELAGFDSLDTALTEFEGANGSPLSSG